MKRHPATRSERSVSRDGHTPGSILPTLDRLATPAGLPRLLELALGGRADTSLRNCRGATWTNVAQRALHLLYAVVVDLGPATPPELLHRIKNMRAVGVNWVHGSDGTPEGDALFNYGTFQFDTTELRRTAAELLEQQPRESVPPKPSNRPRVGPSLAARIRKVQPTQSLDDGQTDESGQQLDEIIEEHHEAVRGDPTAPEPYRALHKLYVHREEFDRAWCACQALSLLGKANAHERQFFEEYRPKSLLPVKSRLDTTLWRKNLYHPDENLDVAHVFEVLAPAALKLKIHLLRDAGQLSVMDERFKQDPKGSTVTLVKTFGWAAEILGIRCPDLYVRSDLPGALVAVPRRPPASLAGSTVCSGLSPQELAFVVGKHMSFFRAEHYVKSLFPDASELTALFHGALELVGVDAPVADGAVQSYRDLLRKCVEQDRMGTLRQAVHRWVKNRAPLDIGRFNQAVELTACRAGLLLSGDLGSAWAMINAEPQSRGDMSAEEKLKDLFVFAVSAEYFTLRTILGITIA